jgi:hypothetical protein
MKSMTKKGKKLLQSNVLISDQIVEQTQKLIHLGNVLPNGREAGMNNETSGWT